MKVHIDIDCSPEEARRMFGLPDLQPMQETVLKEMQDRLVANLRAMDAETLWKTWMPAGVQGFEQLQKFWSQFAAAAGGKEGKRG